MRERETETETETETERLRDRDRQTDRQTDRQRQRQRDRDRQTDIQTETDRGTERHTGQTAVQSTQLWEAHGDTVPAIFKLTSRQSSLMVPFAGVCQPLGTKPCTSNQRTKQPSHSNATRRTNPIN